jgi:acyl carrier protein
MMTTLDLIIGYIREMTDAEVTADTKLQDLELDSLDALDLVFQIEGEFDIEFPHEKLVDFAALTMAEIAGHVDRMRMEQAA